MAQLNINKLLKQYRLTQKDLAECTGINKNTISKYCNDTFENINKTHIDVLCKFFDCTPNDLFEVDTTVEVENPYVIFYDNETDEFEANNKSIKELKSITSNYEPTNISCYIPMNNNKKSVLSDIGKAILDINMDEICENSSRYIPVTNSKTNISGIKSSNKYNKIARKVLEQQAKRLDLEHDFEINVNKILDSIICNSDPTIQEHYNELIEMYHNTKNLPLSVKFLSLYRVIYKLLPIQSDSGLHDFLTKLRNIYAHGDLMDLSDEKLQQLYDISIYYVNLFNNKEND
jgi:putative transcriptional regulator